MRPMDEKPGRVEVTVRCGRCDTALARLTPTSAAFRWQVDRIDHVPWVRRPFTLGVSGLGDKRAGLAGDDGTPPSPRMLPVPVPVDAYRTSFTCRRCRNPSTAKLRELRARGTVPKLRAKRLCAGRSPAGEHTACLTFP
jgi:hypothetical protein